MAELNRAGFSGAIGGKEDGVFNLFSYGWGAQENTDVIWHTEDAETDPWEWRLRVLNENAGIAYSKLFFKKAGYITKEWYPYFYAARRGGREFEDDYESGIFSHFAKRIYDALEANPNLSVREIKRDIGLKKEDKSKFEAALTDLQMKMYITMCGGNQRVSKGGEEYGWQCMVYCKCENFYSAEVFDNAAKLNGSEAYAKIEERVLTLNPNADKKKIRKFICG
jgi:hypothetical protein